MSVLDKAIAARGPLIGTRVSVASGELAEALSLSGLDWLFFDMEHSTLGLADVQSMIQAMRPPCLSMIRVEDPLPVCVKHALDTGCDGVIVPQVHTAALAQGMGRTAKFPPQGDRSVGWGRAMGYGATMGTGVSTENTRTALIVQIEHQDAFAEIDAIAESEGVDALFAGPYDLSGSLGIPGQIDDARVQQLLDRVVEASGRAGKSAGVFVATPAAARREIARGFQFVVVGSDLATLVAAVQGFCQDLTGRSGERQQLFVPSK